MTPAPQEKENDSEEPMSYRCPRCRKGRLILKGRLEPIKTWVAYPAPSWRYELTKTENWPVKHRPIWLDGLLWSRPGKSRKLAPKSARLSRECVSTMGQNHQHSSVTGLPPGQCLIIKTPTAIQSPLYRLCQPRRHSPTDIYTPCAARGINA